METTYYNYIEAIQPRSFIICGVELKSFALGHWLVLDRLESTFRPTTTQLPSNFSEKDGISHFLMFLLVCGQTYEDNILMLENPKIFSNVKKKFEKHITKIIKRKRWNVYYEIAMIKEYLEYFSEIPPFCSKTNKPSSSGIDWKTNLLSIMINEYHYTESQALNMPLKKCFYLWLVYGEKNSSIEVSNSYEIESMKQLGVKIPKWK